MPDLQSTSFLNFWIVGKNIKNRRHRNGREINKRKPLSIDFRSDLMDNTRAACTRFIHLNQPLSRLAHLSKKELIRKSHFIFVCWGNNCLATNICVCVCVYLQQDLNLAWLRKFYPSDVDSGKIREKMFQHLPGRNDSIYHEALKHEPNKTKNKRESFPTLYL